MFDLVKISCAHPMAALRLKFGYEYVKRIYEFSFPVYLVEHYSDTLYVVTLESEWVIPEHLKKIRLLPPCYVRKPKKNKMCS